MADYLELPAVPGYISTDQAAKILGISKQRVYQYIGERRLPAFRNGNVILLELEAVQQFKPNITGRPHKKEPPWRIYRGESSILCTDIEVKVRDGQQEKLVQKLRDIYSRQEHTFPGTIQRYVFRNPSLQATTVNIVLIWKTTEMPNETTRTLALKAFQAELADVLDWTTAHILTKEGIIYT